MSSKKVNQNEKCNICDETRANEETTFKSKKYMTTKRLQSVARKSIKPKSAIHTKNRGPMKRPHSKAREAWQTRGHDQ